SKLKKTTFFSLINSITDENKFYQPNQHYCEFMMDAKSLQGVFLPFKYLAFEDNFRTFNAYYVASDFREYHHCIALEDKNINDIKQILNKILVENKNIAESSMELFLQLHTLDWVKEGFFYSSVVLVYTLWENIVFLLGENIKDDDSILRINMTRARNVIAHPTGSNKHFERTEGSTYYFKNGNNDATLTIDDLEKVRQKIIQLLRKYFKI
ncbi:MAG: hypothetical protein KC550_03815, partial [Nanoarchaeota archaeon]|nr:hypothetical protein [Nanoarchaeota archaeon]